MVTEIIGSSLRTIPQESMVTQGKPVESAGKKFPDTNLPDNNSVAVKEPSNVSQLAVDQPERVEENVSRLNEIVQSIQRDLQFSVDDVSGKMVVKVLDTKTQEVIRQIPTEQVLALSENIENLKGILFSAEV